MTTTPHSPGLRAPVGAGSDPIPGPFADTNATFRDPVRFERTRSRGFATADRQARAALPAFGFGAVRNGLVAFVPVSGIGRDPALGDPAGRRGPGVPVRDRPSGDRVSR